MAKPGSTIDPTLGGDLTPDGRDVDKEDIAAAFLAAVTDIEELQTDVAASDPTVNDDDVNGFSIGGFRLNSSSGQFWQCEDNATGAAVWRRVNPTLITGANPGINEDELNGYRQGHIIIRTDTPSIWSCYSAVTGAAQWFRVDGGGAVSALAGGGTFVLDDSNSGALIICVEAVELQIAEVAAADLYWDVLCLSAGVVCNIENDSGTLFLNGADSGGEVTLLDGYESRFFIASNAGSEPQVTAGGGISTSISVPPGPVDLQGQPLRNALVESELLQEPASASGTLAVDLANGNQIAVTLTENITTHTITGWPSTDRRSSVTYRFVQGASAYTLSWFAAADWGAAGAPTMPTGAGDEMIVTGFTDDGGTSVKMMLAWSD